MAYELNASKCSVICISQNSRKGKETNYTLHGQTLAVEELSKYLGMMLTNSLSWNKHVEKVAAKGNRTQLFIKRNLRQYTKPVNAASHTPLNRPALECASTVWDPPPSPTYSPLNKSRRERIYSEDSWLRDSHAGKDWTHCRTDGEAAYSPCYTRMITN